MFSILLQFQRRNHNYQHQSNLPSLFGTYFHFLVRECQKTIDLRDKKRKMKKEKN